ncbi:tRNA lysidine(34) synthetase TilS [Streptococcus suis]|nr:tRNA lysidine(34) synthetase TilS [Streptococcus suis]
MIKPEDFLAHVQQRQFFSDHQKVLIAVSGGVDSMNLLHFLYVSRETLGIRLGIVHVNHHQRAQSQEEEAFLKTWSTDHEIPFYVGHFTESFTEEKARDFRYHFFRTVMEKEGYTALVTAHHADDQAETILMRIIRGSKLRYQVGIKERQSFANGELIRPLLVFAKEDLPNPFHFEDVSNADHRYFRNRVRNNYLPAFQEENPKINQALLRHGDELGQLLLALKELTKTIDTQDCQVFRSQIPAVQRFLLQHYLDQFPDLQLGQAQFETLRLNLVNLKSYDYPLKNGYGLRKHNNRFEIYKIGLETDSLLSEVLVEYGSLTNFKQYQFSYDRAIETHVSYIPLVQLSPVLLRSRQPGDRIVVRKISKKLRRFFIDEKISPKERENTIIIEQENKILAVICDGKTYLSNPHYHDIMRGKLYIQKM